jgi:hypothetical protein
MNHSVLILMGNQICHLTNNAVTCFEGPEPGTVTTTETVRETETMISVTTQISTDQNTITEKTTKTDGQSSSIKTTEGFSILLISLTLLALIQYRRKR